MVSEMGAKIKGIYKGFKYSLTQIFVKEPEIEIGGPTDVKHVAHIGLDGSSGTAPSWMNEYKTGNDFAATSIGNSGSASSSGISPWSSREFGESTRQQSKSDEPSMEVSAVKKERRKKPRSNNSSKSNDSCSSRPSRQGKSKTKFIEDNAKTTNIEVV